MSCPAATSLFWSHFCQVFGFNQQVFMPCTPTGQMRMTITWESGVQRQKTQKTKYSQNGVFKFYSNGHFKFSSALQHLQHSHSILQCRQSMQHPVVRQYSQQHICAFAILTCILKRMMQHSYGSKQGLQYDLVLLKFPRASFF